MRTYIKTYDLSKEWPPADTLRWCYRNSFNTQRKADGHSGGIIVSQLKQSLKQDRDYLIVAHDGEKLTGWGIVYKDFRWMFQVYVPVRNRRKGIGSKILERACKIRGRVEVYDIDTSNEFYVQNGLTKNTAITGRKLKKKIKK